MNDTADTPREKLQSLRRAVNVWTAASAGRERALVEVMSGCALMAVGANIALPVPFTDVPMTLQLLAVLITAFTLPAGRANAAVLCYVAGGSLGLPFFAPGSLGLFGPNGGYILGFVVAVWLIGTLRSRNPLAMGRLSLAGVAAVAAVFFSAVCWRAIWLRELRAAFVTGFLPFAPKAGLELAVALALVRCVGGRRGGFTPARRK